MKRPFILFLVLVPFIVACRSRTASTHVASSIVARWTGHEGGGDVARTRVLHSTAEWDAFWKEVNRERPRPLNPAREMAIIISLGEKRTGGFSVEVLGTRIAGGKLIVDYRENRPPPGAMVSQALTAPWAALLVPRTDLPVVAHSAASPDSPDIRQK